MSAITAGRRRIVRQAARFSPLGQRLLSAKAIAADTYDSYSDDPIQYASGVLGVEWWSAQREIVRALLEHRRVAVKASHSVGKTHLAAGLVNWFYDVFRPSICITTAPSYQQVVDVLWKEVRVQRRGRPGLAPKAPRLEDAADHFAVGYTALKPDAFQGRHETSVLIIFDEATGISAPFWDAAEGMMTGPNCLWLVIFNPTDTASRAYEETLSDRWHVISVSALDHPNIAAELSGEPVPFPAAVRLAWVRERCREWCTQVVATDSRAGDFELEGHWYRPGPLAESRMLGRWPTAGSTSVWSEAAWSACLRQQPVDLREPLQVGCDVARFGDDFTSMIVRRGNCALHHETHNGWDTGQTAGRLRQLCKEFARTGGNGIEAEAPNRVRVCVDDDGVGGGVLDQKGDFCFEPCSGANKSLSEDYPNRRSESWFAVAERADEGRLDLTRLTSQSQALLRRQVMAPTWKLDSQGRRVVEPKDDTKKRIGRSPDDADALNLAFGAPSGGWALDPRTWEFLAQQARGG